MRHTAVVDLGYGDAGKGTVVDWLVAHRPVHAVVRFNGGAQAAHNVVTPDGRHHTFAQFGSGTLQAGTVRPVTTFLSRFMLVEPLALASEADHLRRLGVPEPLDLLTVDRAALLTTPYHAAANRARERARGTDRHGSCGIGVGETMSWALAVGGDAPRVGDIASPARLTGKLRRLVDAVATEHVGNLDGPLPPVEDVVAAYTAFANRVRLVDGDHLRELLDAGEVVFEGAQGVLLDEWRGFHPHTTWSTTTFDNVETLLAEVGADPGSVRRLGVLRTYTTRHGAGPHPTEDRALAASLPEPHNGSGAWQGGFRVGHFDAVAHRYALEVVGGVDELALTHLDAAARVPGLRVATGYKSGGKFVERLVPGPFADLGYQEQLTGLLRGARPVWDPAPVTDWTETVSAQLGVPVTVASYGPTCADKQTLELTGKPLTATLTFDPHAVKVTAPAGGVGPNSGTW